jgi:hypothetical protein
MVSLPGCVTWATWLMENRHGLVVGGIATMANGTAECIWIAIAPRLRCEECKKKMAKLTLEPATVAIKRIPRRSITVH